MVYSVKFLKVWGFLVKHRARKRFGQNFLTDEKVIYSIVSAINPLPGQSLIEIGPGQGALTFELLESVGEMQAVEIDRDLIRYLRETSRQYGQLELIEADALTVDFRDLGQSLRIVGNLPYNISTPLILHLLAYVDVVQDMHFMLQKEVVQRMAAKSGSKTYGRLSVMTQSVCDARLLFLVPPECFTPAPKVESAIVYLAPRKVPLEISDRTHFAAIVTEAFNQRRKTLRNVWRNRITPEELEQLDINPTLRPERVTLEEFVKVSNFLVSSAC